MYITFLKREKVMYITNFSISNDKIVDYRIQNKVNLQSNRRCRNNNMKGRKEKKNENWSIWKLSSEV